MNPPRVHPISRREMGVVNGLVARRFARRIRVENLPHVFTTLARSRRLFTPYMKFAYRLMPAGTLPRTDTELLILRTAANTGCSYEWHHHCRIAERVGMTRDEIERVRDGADAGGWSTRQALLLRAADELHLAHDLSDEVWDGLRSLLTEEQVIELILLVGNYEMLAMMLKSLRVQIEEDSEQLGR